MSDYKDKLFKNIYKVILCLFSLGVSFSYAQENFYFCQLIADVGGGFMNPDPNVINPYYVDCDGTEGYLSLNHQDKIDYVSFVATNPSTGRQILGSYAISPSNLDPYELDTKTIFSQNPNLVGFELEITGYGVDRDIPLFSSPYPSTNNLQKKPSMSSRSADTPRLIKTASKDQEPTNQIRNCWYLKKPMIVQYKSCSRICMTPGKCIMGQRIQPVDVNLVCKALSETECPSALDCAQPNDDFIFGTDTLAEVRRDSAEPNRTRPRGALR